MTADDHAPTRGSRGAELRGTDAFRALLEGRLTVVDRFDRDGRTFLVAVHSHTLTLPERALSAQERCAASLVRLGHANKAIAVDLRLSESRVSTLMRAVTELLLDGASNAEIAAARGTSRRTVANQIATIFRKLDASSRVDLAARIFGATRG